MLRSISKLLIAQSVMMIGVFMLVQFNRTANLHYHLDDRGNLFSHSHPYDKSADSGPVKTHGHGKYHLIAPTASAEMVLPAHPPVPGIGLVLPATMAITALRIPGDPDICFPGGRSPPVVAII